MSYDAFHQTYPGWLSPGGGLVWHARAFRWRNRWKPFIGQLEQWLSGWQPPSASLLLLGPSAGWCLPTSFLLGFKNIHAVDFDPLAPLIFQALHGRALRQAKVRLTWQSANIFVDLEKLLQAHPTHVVLFANLLGQHRLYCTDVYRAEAQLVQLSARLKGRHWASFHDLVSRQWPHGWHLPQPLRAGQMWQAQQLLKKWQLGGVWLDHLTSAVLPNKVARQYLVWPINAGRAHVIEAGWVSPEDI
jgi:hypothetical protein